MLKVLLGHTTFETAYEIADYPYGSLRCKKRVWVETKPKHGMRLVECTENPKTGRWNKPHAGTYSDVTILVLEPQPDGREFVSNVGLGFHATDEQINKLRLQVGDQALHDAGVWKTIVDNRAVSHVMNMRYTEPERRFKLVALPPFEEIVSKDENKEKPCSS